MLLLLWKIRPLRALAPICAVVAAVGVGATVAQVGISGVITTDGC